jgi:serine/threonine-protein kinase
VDWQPSELLRENCPHCETLLEETVKYYSLNQCVSCRGVFRPVLESVGVRSNRTLERFGRFPISETLGHGGMGIVYKAHHPQRNTAIALKLILNQFDWSAISRFYREGETIARLKHPHIVKIHEVGEYDGIPYLALEYLAGGSLLDRLKRGRLPVDETMALSIPMARALEYAHAHGVVHRDLKPGNILLMEDGTPKISDFGLVKRMTGQIELGQATISFPAWYGFLRKIYAKSDPQSALRGSSKSMIHPDMLSDVGEILGTPAYMAPEQAQGDSERVGPAADLFAFGVMLYQMLAGHLPFAGKSFWEIQRGMEKAKPLPPSAANNQTPRALDEIVMKCINRAPQDRFASARELAEALESLRSQ